MTVPDTRIECSVPPGVGTSLTWRVSVGGQSSGLTPSSFRAPEITDVVGPAGGLASGGGETVTLSGWDFGPLLTTVSATYGPYSASACTVTVAHVQIECQTVQGQGTGHAWVVTVGAQDSAASAQTSDYAAPLVDSVQPLILPSRRWRGGQPHAHWLQLWRDTKCTSGRARVLRCRPHTHQHHMHSHGWPAWRCECGHQRGWPKRIIPRNRCRAGVNHRDPDRSAIAGRGRSHVGRGGLQRTAVR